MTNTNTETRELVVTVSIRIPLGRVLNHYAEAITPDGGWEGTANAYIAEYAEGVMADMARAELLTESTSSWRIEAPVRAGGVTGQGEKGLSETARGRRSAGDA